MNTRKIFFISMAALLLSFTACKKETTFKYKANCIECKISFYDESGSFVSREAHQGAFEKEISVVDYSPVMIAVQSTAFADSASTSPIFATDLISVEIYKDGELDGGDTSANGKKNQAVTYQYDWQK